MSYNINDIMGQREKEREIGFLLKEVLKLLLNKHQEFNDDVRRIFEDIDNLYLIIAHVDQQNNEARKHAAYLTELWEQITIASDPDLPRGYIGNLKPLFAKFKKVLTDFLVAYKRSDFKILHDLGIKMHDAAEQEDEEPKGVRAI